MLAIPNLSAAQLKGLATIFSDTGQILLATVVVPFLFRLAIIDAPTMVAGFLLTLFCYFASIRLLKEVEINE